MKFQISDTLDCLGAVEWDNIVRVGAPKKLIIHTQCFNKPLILAHEFAHIKLKHGVGCNTKRWFQTKAVIAREVAAWKLALKMYTKVNLLTIKDIAHVQHCLFSYHVPHNKVVSLCQRYVDKYTLS